MEDFTVMKIDKSLTNDWILHKHYAKRKCSISYAFGLFNKDGLLVGVCTFGFPPNYNFNEGKCIFNNYRVLTLELNRLIVNEGLGKNVLSFFVSKALDLLPKPSCIVSYADPNYGHNGYIYQATNWIYTGDSTPKHRYTFEDGTTFDIRRGIDIKEQKHGKIIKKETLLPTRRYIFFNGNKKEKKKMFSCFKLKILPYPKGDNKRYDVSYECQKIYIDKKLFEAKEVKE